MITATRTRAPSLHVEQAARPVIIARAEDGKVQGYVETPVGWRLRGQAGRPDGELVTEPWLIALLDHAAAVA